MTKVRIIKRMFDRGHDYALEVDGHFWASWEIDKSRKTYCIYEQELDDFLEKVATYFGIEKNNIPIVEEPTGPRNQQQ